MLDIDLEDELVRKVGGKFALTTLLQRRLVELNRGDPPLVKMDIEVENRRVACEEIRQGKIALVRPEVLEHTAEQEDKQIEAEPPPGEPGDDAEIYGSDIKKIKEQRIKELSQLLNPNKK
jgi:DNA-directed RNA polymerase subunit omega